MKNICFVSNFEKTEFFLKISKYFEKNRVFWICVNLKEFQQVNKYYDQSSILYLKKNQLINTNINSNLKINELLFSDRSLQINKKKDHSFLINAELKITNFIKEKNIKFVFSEFTWAHEILINLICEKKTELNCKHFNPGAVRIIPDRFLFFENLDNSKYFFKENYKLDKLLINENYYRDFIKSHSVQKKIFNLKFIWLKVLKLFFNDYFDFNDPRKISKLKRVKNFVLKYSNFIIYNLFKKKTIDELENKKFVIYYLQKQPEANTDVKGIYYSDHFTNIQNIWKILPPDFQLIIKQHPACTGDNNFLFYRKIKNLINVHLIDELSSNDFKKKKPYATFSINSTASMETALSGIPSFTFANCFFNELKFSKKICLDDFKKYDLFELTNVIKQDNELKKDLSDVDFLKSSYPGFLYGSNLLEENNVKNIVNSINDLIS